MKIKPYGQSNDTIIGVRIRNIIMFYSAISLLILIGMFSSRFLDEPYKYLLISSSFYNYPYLSWVSGVWGSLLGVHGTIAALSITFMGMFVAEISTSSEYGFKSVTKLLLLRRYEFLDFSIKSVCSLLCGIFLLLSGSGLIGYFVSSIISMFFIIRYGVMYYNLYQVTERPEIISGVLFDAIKSTGEKYDDVNKHRQQLTNDFSQIINANDCYSAGQDMFYWDDDVIVLGVFPDDPDAIISGFNPEVFESLTLRIKKMNEETSFIVCFSLSFLSPLSNSSIKVTPSGGGHLTEEHISEIESFLRKGLVYSKAPYVYSEFRQFEESLVSNIRNSLLHGDEWSLDFGVRIFYELTSSDNYVYTLQNIDLSITSSNSKDVIRATLLAKFLEKMIIEAINQNDLKKTVNIMRSIIDLARYIYGKNNFFEFYKKIFRQFEHKIRYQADDSDYVFLELYTSVVIRNLVYGNYPAFKLDSDFITNKLKYLELNNKVEYDALNEMQRRLLICTFEVITLLIMRIEHVEKKGKEYSEELQDLILLLKSWVNAKFLQELYYKRELYDILFSIPQEFTVFDAETKIREIPDGEATWRSIKNDTYKMIALMLTQSSFNSNKLNLLFIRDGLDFVKNTSILTNDLQSIIAFLNSESFSKLIGIITDKPDCKDNIIQVAAKLESVVSLLNSVILREVIESKLDSKLVDEYISEIRTSVEKYFELILSMDDVIVEDKVSGMKSYLLVNKREIIPPIDGVSYGMNTHNHSQWLIYEWIRGVLNSIGERNILDIDSLQDLTTDRLITIEYKVDSRSDTFKYSKGMRVNDKEGYLKLNGAGMYYLDLQESFDLVRSAEVLAFNMETINNHNVDIINKRYNFKDDNPYLYAALAVIFNIKAVPKNVCKLYFLSEEKCQMLNEKQDREMKQLLNNNRSDSADNSSVS